MEACEEGVPVSVSARISAAAMHACAGGGVGGWYEGDGGGGGGGGSVERKLNMPHSISHSTIGGLRINAGR